MKNLINLLSLELQSKLTDFVISGVYIDAGELLIVSQYEIDESFYKAVQKELLVYQKLGASERSDT
jgi:hypothetical protein